MIELDLLHILANRDNYSRYKKYVKEHTLTTETSTVIKDIGIFFDTYPDTEIKWDKFGTWFKLVRHPGLKEEQATIYTTIFSKLGTYTASEVTDDVIEHYIGLDCIGRILDIGNRIIDGDTTANIDQIKTTIDEYNKEKGTPKEEVKAITNELSELLSACVVTDGIEWRLKELNISIGPLRFGDLIIVGARPETGKTTFIASEITHFASQIKDSRPILIFNNEEEGKKIGLRLYQSALGLTLPDLVSNATKYEADYAKIVNGKDRIRVFNIHGWNTKEIEALVIEQNPCVVVFNVLDPDKIVVGKELNQAAENKKLGAWARTLGMTHKCLVFGIVQADGSAQNVKWIEMSQLYGSKTGLQGEADVIITIGAESSSPTTRYIHVPKNKLPGGKDSDPKEKHGFFEVEFDSERGRYLSGALYK